MGTAQSNFSSVCGDVTYGEYCGVVWQAPSDLCCGLCPSPALHSYGTLGGLILGSFFNLLIVLFQPGSSSYYIAAQMALGHVYLVAVMARNIMGSLSNGTNGLQLWHSEFGFLLAASTTGLIVGCVLSDTHHIHGFEDEKEFNDYLIKDNGHKTDRLNTLDDDKLYGPHLLHRKQEDHGLQRLRKWGSRNQAKVLLATFVGSELFILYATTIWWKNETTFWQAQCDDFVGKSNFLLVRAVSWTFSAIALVFSLLLCIPVFRSPKDRRTVSKLNKQKHRDPANRQTVRVESAAGFIVRLFSLHHKKTMEEVAREEAAAGGETKAERMVKIIAALVVWFFWLISVIVISIIAWRDFLLLGEPWPYAAIQMFGLFPLCKFFLGVVRSRRRAAHKAAQQTMSHRRMLKGLEKAAQKSGVRKQPAAAAAASSDSSAARKRRGRSSTRKDGKSSGGRSGSVRSVMRGLSQSRAAQMYGGGRRS
ncbi:hypothetical protein JCM6882_006469 [Rhodosporidiobolus microsporus]